MTETREPQDAQQDVVATGLETQKLSVEAQSTGSSSSTATQLQEDVQQARVSLLLIVIGEEGTWNGIFLIG